MKVNKIVKTDLCISCGACDFLSKGKIRMRENKKKGMFLPSFDSNEITEDELKTIEAICPGNGYPIISLAKEIQIQNYENDYRIGDYLKLFAAKSRSDITLRKASSGGVMTELALYLLKHGYVNGVAATIYDLPNGNVFPHTKIFTNPDQLLAAQGSKYMPVPALSVLKEIEVFDGTVVFIGTPCQIATIRLIQKSNMILKEKIKYTIGNFCGGFKDMRELYRLRRIADMNNEKLTEFQYRGNGQPGYMMMTSETGKHWQHPYPDYGKLTGYMKYYRCRVCVDATAELADISCGDAWLPKYKEKGGNWSAIIIRNPILLEVLNKMYSESVINIESLTKDDLVLSQRQNITSKKERYRGRIAFLRRIRKQVPTYDGGWNQDSKTSFFFEAKVYYSQILLQMFEVMGIYPFINKLLKKYRL